MLLATLPAPPPASDDDRNPAVYPPQRISLDFDHSLHVRDRGLPCVTCHAAALGSREAKDYNIPSRETCLACHEAAVVPHRWSARARSRDNAVAIPRPNLHFSHATHVGLDGVECVTCHEGVEEAALATREHLPAMETCLSCHDDRRAPAACATCHPEGLDGTLRTSFASGQLVPDDHGPHWSRQHDGGAELDVEYCASCHAQEDCLSCHEGSIPPASHAGDYLALHSQDAFANAPSCTPCHRVDRFCQDCHRRSGVVPGTRPGAFRGEFHPEGWSTGWVVDRSHHSFVARKNVGACGSCHDGSLCANCHRWLPGAHSIHGPGWRGSSRERRLRRENFDLCLECHDVTNPGDPINGG